MFNLFRRNFTKKHSFDIVAKNGNNVEAAFDFVERIVLHVAFDNVASILLLVWTGLNSVHLDSTSAVDRCCGHRPATDDEIED